MASGYQIDGKDLDDICEPTVSGGGHALTTDPNSVTSMYGHYYNNNDHMGNRYARANTDSWAKTIELPFYGRDYPFKVVEKGYLPTQTKFAEITSAGTYNVAVTDSYFTIGSTTYPASHFRNGVIPRYIGVMLCGGGGGAGGYGCDKGDKNGYNVTQGGGGGGGGVLLLVIDSRMLKSVVIGSGGGGGATGSSDSRPSTGSNGGDGGQTILNFTTGVPTVGCYGGAGGKGGKGNSGSNDSVWGDGGAGGTSWCPTTYGIYSPTHISGGKGGVCGSSGGHPTGSGAYSFTTGAGIDTTTMFNNSNTGQTVDSGNGFRNSWAGGGCSIGSGATNSISASMGGGGSSGKSPNGATGYCAFYY